MGLNRLIGQRMTTTSSYEYRKTMLSLLEFCRFTITDATVCAAGGVPEPEQLRDGAGRFLEI